VKVAAICERLTSADCGEATHWVYCWSMIAFDVSDVHRQPLDNHHFQLVAMYCF
jgi:hypothetical protein